MHYVSWAGLFIPIHSAAIAAAANLSVPVSTQPVANMNGHVDCGFTTDRGADEISFYHWSSSGSESVESTVITVVSGMNLRGGAGHRNEGTIKINDGGFEFGFYETPDWTAHALYNMRIVLFLS